MESLEILDAAQANVAKLLYETFDGRPWEKIRYVFKLTPTADVRSSDYDLVHENGKEESTLPTIAQSRRIGDSAYDHWLLSKKLGQPGWYKMIVTVERSGKFTVEFEYKDDYKEGDIMKRG